MKIVASSPHFFVKDLLRSVRFYVDVLGFDEPPLWGDPPTFAMPQKDGFIVMLNQDKSREIRPNGADGRSWDAYFWCDEVDSFFELIKNRADVIHGPRDEPSYGMREIGIRDPDGYFLVFAADMQNGQD